MSHNQTRRSRLSNNESLMTTNKSRRGGRAAARRRSVFLRSLFSSVPVAIQLKWTGWVIALGGLVVLAFLKGPAAAPAVPTPTASSATLVVQSGGVHVGDTVLGTQIRYEANLERGRR